jgi:hypothetical protein
MNEVLAPKLKMKLGSAKGLKLELSQGLCYVLEPKPRTWAPGNEMGRWVWKEAAPLSVPNTVG